VAGDECAARVCHHEQIIRVLDAAFEDGHDVGQFRHADNGPGSRPQQILIDDDPGRARDHRAPAAPDGRRNVHHGVLDFGDDRCVRPVLLELVAQYAPLQGE
jgi:hypothetical protein